MMLPEGQMLPREVVCAAFLHAVSGFHSAYMSRADPVCNTLSWQYCGCWYSSLAPLCVQPNAIFGWLLQSWWEPVVCFVEVMRWHVHPSPFMLQALLRHCMWNW